MVHKSPQFNESYRKQSHVRSIINLTMVSSSWSLLLGCLAEFISVMQSKGTCIIFEGSDCWYEKPEKLFTFLKECPETVPHKCSPLQLCMSGQELVQISAKYHFKWNFTWMVFRPELDLTWSHYTFWPIAVQLWNVIVVCCFLYKILMSLWVPAI